MKGVAFYLFVYGFMTIGAFAIVIVLQRKGLISDELDDLNGLYQRNPGSAPLPGVCCRWRSRRLPDSSEVLHPAGADPDGHVGWPFSALYIVPRCTTTRVVVHAWLQAGQCPRSGGNMGPEGRPGGPRRRHRHGGDLSRTLRAAGDVFDILPDWIQWPLTSYLRCLLHPNDPLSFRASSPWRWSCRS
jgi:hypothetical protein